MQPSSMASALPRLLSARAFDIGVPAVVLLAVLVVLAPVPAPAVDLLLAANLTVAVLAVLGALTARTPLEMSVFPTFLLGATLIRLVLNIATTRLILSRAGLEWPGAAGQVVQAFAEFVAANDLVVGGVIFAIIAVIQFVVITAGATRTSEVAARFTLDGLPGRQAAIDAEVQQGAISREEARQLRVELQRQAEFFASMDGASRFVRGEAVASVVIAGVNIAGGLAVGVLQHGLPLDRAAGLYSRLTIGDGLATAVPALFISVATGLLISRSTQAVDLPRELGRQLLARPQTLLIASVFLAALALTELPTLPLAVMALGTAAAAWWLSRKAVVKRTGAADQAAAARERTAVGELLADERLVVRLGPGLIGLVAGPRPPLFDRMEQIRAGVAGDLGLLVPAVAFRDGGGGVREISIEVAGEPVFTRFFPSATRFVLPPVGADLGRFAGRGSVNAAEADSSDPLTGRPGLWLSHAQADMAAARGAEVFDELTFTGRLVEAAVRLRADRLLTRDAVARMIESLKETQPTLVAETVPAVVSIATLHRTLQGLLRDGVPIRPFSELLERVGDRAGAALEPAALAEAVRGDLAGLICRRARDPQSRLTVIRLTPAAVDRMALPYASGSQDNQGSGRGSQSHRIVAEIRRALRPVMDRGGQPVLLVPAAVRLQIRDLLAPELPHVRVLAEEDVSGQPRVETFTTIGISPMATGGGWERAA
jgi:flagellar biosynthesis protein FlhA